MFFFIFRILFVSSFLFIYFKIFLIFFLHFFVSILADGKQIRLFSGAIHYFRIPSEYWKDRLQTAVDAGLNCIETYVPWNLHEKIPGNFDFQNDLDLVSFVKLAAEFKGSGF